MGDLHLDALDPGVELLNLDGLVLDVVAQARADLGVTTDDGDIHGGTSFWARGPVLKDRVRQVPATSHGGIGTGVITSCHLVKGPGAPRRGPGRLSLSTSGIACALCHIRYTMWGCSRVPFMRAAP